jgi:hypothetical protein
MTKGNKCFNCRGYYNSLHCGPADDPSDGCWSPTYVGLESLFNESVSILKELMNETKAESSYEIFCERLNMAKEFLARIES